MYSWWFSSRDPPRFFAVQETDLEDGLNDSINLVQNHFTHNVHFNLYSLIDYTQGPYDGIFAFSQGSAFAMLLYLIETSIPMPKFYFLFFMIKSFFRFMILVSPFKSKSTLHQNHYLNKIDIPTLLVYGETDEVVPTNGDKLI